MNYYEERGFSLDKAIHLIANDHLPHLPKRRPISNRFLRVTRGSCSTANVGISKNVQGPTPLESGGLYQTSCQTLIALIYGRMARSLYRRKRGGLWRPRRLYSAYYVVNQHAGKTMKDILKTLIWTGRSGMIALLCLKRVMESARSTKGSTPMTVKRKIPYPPWNVLSQKWWVLQLYGQDMTCALY